MKKLKLFLTIAMMGSIFCACGIKKPGNVSQAIWRLMTPAEKREAIKHAKREPQVWSRPEQKPKVIEMPARPAVPRRPRRPKPYYVGRPFLGTRYVESEKPLTKQRPETVERLELWQKVKTRQEKAAELLRQLKTNWKTLKNRWYVTLPEKEKRFLWPKLSETQKRELKATKNKEAINKIHEKLYSKRKNISEKEWFEAKKAAQLVPGFKFNIQVLLKKPRREVIIAAKTIDNVEKKLLSKRKNILETEWKIAKMSANTIPTYKPTMTRILGRNFTEAIRLAKKIDALEKTITGQEEQEEGEEFLPFAQAKKYLIILNKLPEYKGYIKRTLFLIHPQLKSYEGKMALEELRRAAETAKKRIKKKVKRKRKHRRKKKEVFSSDSDDDATLIIRKI